MSIDTQIVNAQDQYASIESDGPSVTFEVDTAFNIPLTQNVGQNNPTTPVVTQSKGVFHLWNDVRFDGATEVSTKYTQRGLPVNEYVLLRPETGSIQVQCSSALLVAQRTGNDTLYQDSLFIDQLNFLRSLRGKVVRITTRSGQGEFIVTDIQQQDKGDHVADIRTLQGLSLAQLKNAISQWDANVIVTVSVQRVNTSPGEVGLGTIGFASDPGANAQSSTSVGVPPGTPVGANGIILRRTAASQFDFSGLDPETGVPLGTRTNRAPPTIEEVNAHLTVEVKKYIAARIAEDQATALSKSVLASLVSPGGAPLATYMAAAIKNSLPPGENVKFPSTIISTAQEQAILDGAKARVAIGRGAFNVKKVVTIDVTKPDTSTKLTIFSTVGATQIQIDLLCQSYANKQYWKTTISWAGSGSAPFEPFTTVSLGSGGVRDDQGGPSGLAYASTVSNFQKDPSMPDVWVYNFISLESGKEHLVFFLGKQA